MTQQPKTDWLDVMVEFMQECALYFERRDTGGEDRAFWANMSNAAMCRKIANHLDPRGMLVPDGFVAVPREPTTEILKAMFDVGDKAPWSELWAAALSAAAPKMEGKNP